MKDRTMNSASKLHLPGNKLSVGMGSERNLFSISASFWQKSLGIFQLSLTVGVVAVTVPGQEMRYGLRLQRDVVLFPSTWNISLPLYSIYEE